MILCEGERERCALEVVSFRVTAAAAAVALVVGHSVRVNSQKPDTHKQTCCFRAQKTSRIINLNATAAAVATVSASGLRIQKLLIIRHYICLM